MRNSKSVCMVIRLIGITSFALAGTAAAQVASGDQSTAMQDDTGLQEIVVTAQRRKENLQNVPIGITVVQSEELANSNIRSINDLQSLVPSLQYTPANGGGFQIRGVGTQSFDYSIEQAVSTVVDDVVMDAPRDPGLIGLVDLDRVEVLRGPQGTLFGKNSTSGVVSVSTKGPVLGETSVSASAAYGERDEFNVNAILNIPLGDQVALRVTAFGQGQNGYGENVYLHRKTGAYTEEGLRAKLLFKPVDDLSVELRADFAHHFDDSLPNLAIPGTVPSAAAVAAAGVVPGPDRFLNADPKFDFLNNQEVGTSLNINYSFLNQVLTSITAYRRTAYDGQAPLDIVPSELYVPINTGVISTRKASEELRLASTTGGYVEYVAGVFFNRLKLDSTQDQWGPFGAPLPPGVYLATTGAAGTTTNQDRYSTVNQSEAVFGQIKVNFTNDLDLALGGRYSHDHNSASLGFGSVPSAFVIVPLFPAPTPAAGTATASKFSYTISPQYRISPNVMAYLTYATGYKGPGVAFVNSIYSPYRTETAVSYEAGVKSEVFDHRLRINADVFLEKYRDFQAQTLAHSLGLPTFVLGNAGGLKSEGFEMDSSLAITRNLTMKAGVTFAQAVFTNYIDGPNDYTNQYLPYAPRWSGNLGVDYRHDLFGDYQFNASASDSYRSSQFSVIGDPNSIIHSYGVVDGRLGVGPRNARWQAGIYGRNLLDKHFYSAVGPLVPLGYIGYGSQLAYRTIGAFVNATF